MAEQDFSKAIDLLKNSQYINYTQIGLQFILYKCEVLYNRALCHIAMDKQSEVTRDLSEAKSVAVRQIHFDIIDGTPAEGWNSKIFQMKNGTHFEILDIKLNNLQSRTYLQNSVSVKRMSESLENKFLEFTDTSVTRPISAFWSISRPKTIVRKKSHSLTDHSSKPVEYQIQRVNNEITSDDNLIQDSVESKTEKDTQCVSKGDIDDQKLSTVKSTQDQSDNEIESSTKVNFDTAYISYYEEYFGDKKNQLNIINASRTSEQAQKYCIDFLSKSEYISSQELETLKNIDWTKKGFVNDKIRLMIKAVPFT